MTEIVSKPDWGEKIIKDDNNATAPFQAYLDDIAEKLNAFLLGQQVQLPSYAVLDLPGADRAGGLVFVTNETGGAVPAFSDGTDWRRVTDRAVVS